MHKIRRHRGLHRLKLEWLPGLMSRFTIGYIFIESG